MRFIRRAGGVAVAALLLSGFVSGASAAPNVASPETYLGSAASRALHLRVASTQATLGASNALASSDLKAVAEGVGALGLPVLGGSNAGVSEVSGSGSDLRAKTCVTPGLPVPGVDTLLSLKAACSSSVAEILEAGPHALGTGTVSEIDLSAQSLAAVPIGILQPVLDQVFAGVETHGAPILDMLNDTLGTDLKVDDTVDELLTALATTKTLEVRLGESVSEVTAEGATITSVAKAAGGKISILPIGAAGLKPVVEIEIGSASATAVYDRATGTSTPSFDPSIVTVRINTPTTDDLGNLVGVNFQEIKIAPDLALPTVGALAQPCADAANEYCVLPGTPFETRIAVASGRTVTNADGSVGAVADAVKIHALKNIGQLIPQLSGGLLLELAHAEAGVGGVPAKTVVDVPQIDTPRELPRTGGTPWLPILGGTALLLAVASRRVLVRSH